MIGYAHDETDSLPCLIVRGRWLATKQCRGNREECNQRNVNRFKQFYNFPRMKYEERTKERERRKFATMFRKSSAVKVTLQLAWSFRLRDTWNISQ